MHSELATLTRAELYEQVWSTPMRKLAERYNLSDVGLAKVCKRHNIPRPPVGYWAKREVGKASPRPPLPPLEEDEPISIESDACAATASVDESPRRRPTRSVSDGRRIGSPLLISAAREQLLRGKPDAEQLVRTNAHTAASIRVARASINRALRLFQSLIHLWNQAGGTVQRSEVQDGLGTEFCLRSRSIPVHLAEITEAVASPRVTSRYVSRESKPVRQPTGIEEGVSAGKLTIVYEGRDRWGFICLLNAPGQVVAHIVEADDDAGGAVYADLRVESCR